MKWQNLLSHIFSTRNSTQKEKKKAFIRCFPHPKWERGKEQKNWEHKAKEDHGLIEVLNIIVN